MSQVLRSTAHAIKTALSEKGALRASGLVKADKRGCSSLSLGSGVVEFILGLQAESNRDTFFREESRKDCLPLDCFATSEDHIRICKSLLQSPTGCNILFHGQPGVGKTELARSLAFAAGKKAYIVSQGDGEDVSERRRAAIAAMNALDPRKAVVIVDEADRILNTRNSYFFTGESSDKAWLNAILDKRQAACIWISNSIQYIDESTLRRFQTNVEIKRMGAKHRIAVWSRLAKEKEIDILASDQIVKLANDYDVTPAAISVALEAVKPLIRKKVHPDRVPEIIGREIENHQRLLGRRVAKLRRISPNYSTDFLNVDASATVLFDRLQKRTSTEFAALFYGPPGTGKTEFAKYVAKLLDKPLLLKRASELISCYVGQTERNLANVFEEAAHEDSVLLLDEVDSFLRTRESAHHSWEITAVNELLTQIETFRGILLASTNAVETLDPACLRRFTFKIGFKPLRSEQKVRLYLETLGPFCEKKPTKAELEQVSRIPELTPGDFRVVADKARFLKSASHALLLGMLEQESIFKSGGKKGRIGIKP